MLRTAAILTVAGSALITSLVDAHAQELTRDQVITACKADQEKHCAGVLPGNGRIIQCLVAAKDKLTPTCKVVADRLAAGERPK